MRARRFHGDDGNTYAVVIVFPLVVMIFMAFVQWALFYHAEALVNAAAQDGARTAQSRTGTPADGERTARSTLADATRSRLLTNLAVTVTPSGPTGTDIRATVSADVPQLVPFPLPRTVSATASGPKERFIPAGAAP